MIRAFVAVRMSPAVEEAIVRLIESARGGGGGISWVRPANLHLTLRFLGGAVDRGQLARLDRGLERVAAGFGPFRLGARGAGAFPNFERPRVVWIGLDGADLPRLARGVEMAAVEAGFPAETRPYAPHLTIGRVRDARGWPPVREALREASGHDFGTTLIERMGLYRSILGKGPADYVELARYDFRQSGQSP